MFVAEADIIVLLTVRFAGRDWRFASRPIDLASDTGALHFGGGIDSFEFDDSLELLSGSPSLKTVPFEVIFPDDVAELVTLGHDLGAATAEVALIDSGDAWEDRIVLLDGILVDPEYGENGEAVRFSVEENAFEDAAVFPDPTAIVTAGTTWTAPDDAATTKVYPFVFGNPGVYTDSAGVDCICPGSPALYVETGGTDLMLVADGDTEAAGGPAVAASVVRIIDVTAGLNEAFTASRRQDLTGRWVSAVNVTAAAVIPLTAGHEYWASWGAGGGAWNSRRTRALCGAGELLTRLLAASTLRVDVGRTEAAARYLDRYRVAGYTDECASPQAWIVDNLLPILPVSMCSGPDGIYPAVWRYDARPEDAVARLVEGEGLTRSGPVSYEGRDQVLNEITLSYAQDAQAGDYRRSRTVHGGETTAVDWFSTAHSRTSHGRYGRRARALSSSIIYEDATADIVLSGLVMALGLARRVARYEARQAWGWLSKGDTVLLTSDALHLDDQIALVRGVQWALTGLSLELVLVEDVARDLRLSQL